MKKTPRTPPQLFLRFFRWFCHPSLKKYIEGDLMELYDERLKASGKLSANIKFTFDVLLLFRPGIIRPVEGHGSLNNYGMFKNYFKVSIRNILKYKVFSFINVFGLAVAMSICMLIILMLADQNRYDAFHEKKDRIYRVLSGKEGERHPYATAPFPLASALKAEYPIIEESTSLTPGIEGDATYQQRIINMRGYFAEPSFFRIFSFELDKGDKSTALSSPNSMIITSALAHQLFGDENPLGKTVDFTDRQSTTPVPWGSFTITGVMNEKLYVSHLKFDALVSYASMPALYADKKIQDFTNNWEWYYRTYTYVVLDPARKSEDLALALNDLVAHKYGSIKSKEIKGFYLLPQKLADIRLAITGNDTEERLPGFAYYFLSILALIIMVSACLNYTNLSVARALTRAKEIGVRKVTGANRKALIFQFLSESVITALLALVMAVILLLFIKPAFKGLWINQYLHFELPDSVSVYAIFIGFAFLIGIIAGLYPAMHLSTYQPIKALKDLNNIRPGKLGMRKVLSVTQFVISLFFITTSILIFNQFKHFLEFDYGFTAKNVVNIQLQGNNYEKLSNELRSVPGVAAVSACDIIPAAGGNNGIQLKKVDSIEEYTEAGILQVDENFTTNLDLRIIAGKNLPAAGAASDRFIVVNEEAVRKLGYKYPADIVGQVFESKWGGALLEVCGVVEDFRYKLLVNEDKISPLVLQNLPDHFIYANVKITSANPMSTVAKLEEVWKRLDPTHPFRYGFYDDELTNTHQGIFDAVTIIGFIAFLAITIACLGLLGMATYTAERKAKEVGIRKILGAENFTIAVLLSREFFIILMISIGIAGPLSYFINNLWLEKFPNRVDFGFGTVFLGSLVLLVLGAITIGSQTMRASRRNPVDSLKME